MLVGVAALLIASTAAQPATTSRYTHLSSCRLWAAGNVAEDAREDWVIRRCAGIRNQAVWIRFREGTRMEVGFGSRPNFAGIFETNRDEKWPVEWRGRVIKGRFVPSAAIVRLRGRFDDSGVSDLVVYRLRPDGTSCLVRSASTNAEARAIADTPAPAEECSNWDDIQKR